MDYMRERKAICEVGGLLYERGYVAGGDGNISVLVDEGRLLITPSGVGKGRMTPDMLLLTDLDGTVLEGDRHPSSEAGMHVAVYRRRPDVRAVVHAHPQASTAFAVCRRALDLPYLAEQVIGLGEVPVTPSFALPSTDEVPESVAPYLEGHNAVLLAGHGALTWGEDLWQAFDRMETLEHTAGIVIYTEILGGGVPLGSDEVARLKGLRKLYRELSKKIR
jgi:L-fuculose-phosphate aldolase